MVKSLKIIHTSDTHGYFYPTTYGDMLDKNVGLFSCVSGFEKDENTLVIDGGDSLQGNAFAYFANHSLKSAKIIAQMMNDCGYDYYCLGNHDFNYGQDYQKTFRDNHNGRCICQNVVDEEGNYLYPYDIKVMPSGLRVGIVGIVTDFINVWEKKENLVGVSVIDPFIEAKKVLDELKGKTDINICVYHGGFEADLDSGKRHTDSTENIGYKICMELDFDILLTGHQHMSVDGRYIVAPNGHKTYVVQPLDAAKEYSKIMVEFDEDTKNINISSEKINADYTTAKQAVSVDTGENLYKKYSHIENQTQGWLNEPVGTLSEALVPEDKLYMALNGTKIADFFNRIQIHYSGAQISAVGLANEIAGFNKEVTTRDIIATYPYPNTLVVLKITGDNLKKAIERSAEYFATNDMGEVVISDRFLHPKLEHYNYDYYYNVEYSIDPSKPIGSRVVKLQYQGRDILPDDTFTMCLNNYRSSGAGEYPMYPQCEVVKEINVEMVELLMEYFNEFKYIEV